ncbi:MAG TPA: hypothetical protein VHE55_09695 [Fimbriimonadaceae bacterium]|nr:hypothetical protein [Fimbriimonadaceae bacterium]
MNSSIGQVIALTTFANAALCGRRVPFDFDSNPWFAHCRYLCFQVGEDSSHLLAQNVESWLDYLVQTGFTRAYLWFEPLNLSSGMQDIQMLVFAGNSRWAPVTCLPDLEILWHERFQLDKEDKDKPWMLTRAGFRVMPGQSSLTSTVSEAAAELRTSLDEMTTFQRRHRPDEPFDKMFDTGLQILDGTQRWADRVASAFPPDIYPDESLRLVGAVEAAWTLGGMGWWNDWSNKESAIQAEFEEITKRYYVTMGKALFAACNVTL